MAESKPRQTESMQPVAPGAGPVASVPAGPAPQPAKAEAKKPEPAVAVASMPRFRVEWSDLSEEIEAPNAADAWAMFCDRMKQWPSPKSGKVTPIKK